MENLYQYFDSYVIELFEKDVMICKKINDSYVIIKSNGYDVIHKDMYENYALSIENLKIHSDINLVNGFSMYEFISLPEYIITMDNLRLLEDKYIILEWYNENQPIKYKNCSYISCMKVHKFDETIIYDHDVITNPNNGIFAKKLGSNEYNEKLFMQPWFDWAFITIDKLTQRQYYKWDLYNCDEINYNFKWKIWLPISCYLKIYMRKNECSQI